MAENTTAEGGTPMADRTERPDLTAEQRDRIEAVLERIEREIAELRAGVHPEMGR